MPVTENSSKAKTQAVKQDSVSHPGPYLFVLHVPPIDYVPHRLPLQEMWLALSALNFTPTSLKTTLKRI